MTRSVQCLVRNQSTVVADALGHILERPVYYVLDPPDGVTADSIVDYCPSLLAENPDISVSCNNFPCAVPQPKPLNVLSNTSDSWTWPKLQAVNATPCSEQCSVGRVFPSITCRNQQGQPLPWTSCGVSSQYALALNTSAPCNTAPCLVYYYATSDVRPCVMTPSSCPISSSHSASQLLALSHGADGHNTSLWQGTKSRIAQCSIFATGKAIFDAFCYNILLEPPPLVQICNSKPCVTYTLFVGPWSECSASCGVGVMRRPVACTASIVNPIGGFTVYDAPLTKCVVNATDIPLSETPCESSETCQQACDEESDCFGGASMCVMIALPGSLQCFV